MRPSTLDSGVRTKLDFGARDPALATNKNFRSGLRRELRGEVHIDPVRARAMYIVSPRRALPVIILVLLSVFT